MALVNILIKVMERERVRVVREVRMVRVGGDGAQGGQGGQGGLPSDH